nr:uncharacterized protein LOC126542195 [Dermacentor andersoni]
MYIYCQETVSGYYYSTKTQKCRHTEEDINYTCPYSGRLYKTSLDCQNECFSMFGGNPEECETAPLPLYSRCRAIDMIEGAWWFFSSDVNQCAEWDFPEGSCPHLTGEEQYRSEEACKRSCSGPYATQKTSCRWPEREVCDIMHLKYQSAMAYMGYKTCVSSSAPGVKLHCYLNRTALYSTEEECQKNCMGAVKNWASRRT